MMASNLYNFKTASIDEYSSLFSFLEQSDLDYCNKISNVSKKNASLAVRGLLRNSLFDHTGEKGWLICKDISGKPYLAHEDVSDIPYISMSHSKTMVAVILSSIAPVGIDIEDWKPRNFAHIAKYGFGAEEKEEIKREGQAAFYRIWTVREAIAKTTGASILSGMNCSDIASKIKLGTQKCNGKTVAYEVLNGKHSLACVISK